MNLTILGLFLVSLINSFTFATSTTTTTIKPKAKDTQLESAVVADGRASRTEVSDSQLDMILKDKRYMQRQLKCILGEVRCDPVGKRLQTVAPLVLRGVCPQCSQTEVRQIQKVILHMQKNFPREWAKLIRSYQ